MEFFIPAADNTEQAESVYTSIKQHAQETTRQFIKDTRIFSIEYYHDGKKYHAEVGKTENLIGDLVIAILEAESIYLICTRYRGVIKDAPIIIGKSSTITHTRFL